MLDDNFGNIQETCQDSYPYVVVVKKVRDQNAHHKKWCKMN